MTFWRRLIPRAFPIEPEPSSPCEAIAAMFSEWARERSLAIGRTRCLRIVGAVAGRHVVVDPGVDGSLPEWVHVFVAVALPAAKPFVVTRASTPVDLVTARLRALFDDRDLGPELRAITVGTGQLRVDLAPGAPPDVVEHAVRVVADTLRAIYGTAELRHSCAS